MKSKKIYSKLIAILFFLNLAAPVFARETLLFTDVPQDYWARDYINFLADKGVIGGYNETTFGPEDKLSRAQAVKILLLATGRKVTETAASSFMDVSPGNTLLKFIESARTQNVVNGYEDNTFRPDAQVTRAEFTKILIKAAFLDISQAEKFAQTPTITFSDIAADKWYKNYVYAASHLGYLSGYGDGTFGPENPVSRAEASKIVYNLLKVLPTNSVYESTVFQFINDSRTQNGKSPLALDVAISEMARRHSAELFNAYQYTDKQKYQADHPGAPAPWTSHQSPDGSSFEERSSKLANLYDVKYELVSENIGFASFVNNEVNEQLQRIHEAMMASTNNHAKNILGNYEKAGVGIVVNNNLKEIFVTEIFVSEVKISE